MTIEITQMCNGCGDIRTVDTDLVNIMLSDVMKDAEKDGWRKVRANKHLCNKCLDKAIK